MLPAGSPVSEAFSRFSQNPPLALTLSSPSSSSDSPTGSLAKLPTSLLPPSDSLLTHTFPEPSQGKSLKFSSIRCLPAPSSLKIQLLQSWTGKKQGPGCGSRALCPPLKEPLCPDQDTT